MLNELFGYFEYSFVRYAMITGVLIALCSSLLGVTLVLKRFSFIGDGLSHVAFGAMAVAGVVGLTNEMALVLPVTIVCAVLLLRTGQNAKIKGDASVAMISVGALAIGYLLMSIFAKSSNLSGDVCATLFGATSILTLNAFDVWMCVILSIIVVAVFILFYHKIFCVTFDESFAKATGMKAGLYNLLIAIVIAVIIVLAMNLVGSLLISALVIFSGADEQRQRNYQYKQKDSANSEKDGDPRFHTIPLFVPFFSSIAHNGCTVKQKRHAFACLFVLEVTPGFEPGNEGFADLCLTTWLCHHI